MTRRILLVDDDESVLSGLKRALYDEPFSISTESVPAKALRLVASNDFDVVVSDHDMPEMSGAIFLEEVRKLDPTVVCFMLTGKATLDMAIAAINEGIVDRFFCKPCNHVDLAASIRSALEQRALLSESRRLLWMYRRQEAQMERLEREYPNLTKVDRDDSGAILLDDLPTDADSLRELMAEIFDRDEGQEGLSRTA